jgi:hypothetical protein
MRCAWLVVAGCGRVAFDPRSDALTSDAPTNVGTDGSAPLGPFGAFGTPVEQTGVNTFQREYGATISDDGLEIYWSSYRTPNAGGSDIWRSTRPDRSAMFTVATQMTSASSVEDDGEPALSHDGLTMYLDHSAPTRLFASTRPAAASIAWSAAVAVESPEANLFGLSSADFGPDDLRLVVADSNTNELYEVTRPDRASPWGVPQLLAGLGGMTGDGYPALRSDGLEIFWESGRQPPVALYHALRPAIDQPFGAPERLSFGPTIDASGVGDPDIPADGRTLVMVAVPGSTEYDVYIAEREPL